MEIPTTDDDTMYLPAPADAVEDDIRSGEGFDDPAEAGDVPEADDGEDTTQLIRDMGHHEAMARVQEAITKRIMNDDSRVELELREKSEEHKRLKAKRENLGVELYGVQQQLAKLQIQLENTHTNFSSLAAMRAKVDEEVLSVRESFARSKEVVDEEKQKVAKNQAELDALNATLRQVEAYNEEMKSEIAVIRRATYKAEEAASDKEKGKKDQDIYIDMLNDQLRARQEELALYEAQLISQRQETKAAADTLLEASREMESISFEKKQLLQQWKSSLIGMSRRDEALQAANEALRAQKEVVLSLESEIVGYKKFIVEEQKKHEAHTTRMEKIKNDEKYLIDEIKKLQDERAKYQERYGVLRKSLTSTDSETEKMRTEVKGILEQIAVVEKNLQIVERERQKIETDVGNSKSAEATVNKAAANMAKESELVIGRIHKVEVEQSALENEMARIKVDALNTSAHNVQLQETLELIVSELKEKDRLIEKYEMEVRQRNDEIEKEMYIVDRLNRKYEALTAGMEDENMGPLEATIKNLTKAIEKSIAETEEVQRTWLRRQTELVNVSAATEEVATETHELLSRNTILNQKSIRVDGQIASCKEETAALKKGIHAMHADMTRLNLLISKNIDLQTKLANANFNLENEFIVELREMERDSIHMESKVKTAKEEKARLLEEVVEIERQIMLWEKKIALEKETQTALDPEVGQAEARAMEKEIHRMRLRYETLQRDQKRMVDDMVLAVEKREAVGLKQRGSKKKGEMTQADLKKKLATASSTLNTTKADIDSFDAAIQQRTEEMEALGAELEKLSKRYSTFEEDANSLQATISKTLYEKQRSVDLANKFARMIKRYEDCKEGRTRPVAEKDASVVLGELSKQESAKTKVLGAIKDLEGGFPHLSEVLNRVANLADVEF